MSNESNNTIVPEGIFKARASGDDWLLSETSKGTPYAHVPFKFTSGPAAGRTLSKDFYFSEKTWEKSVESLRACGWKGEDIDNLQGIDANEVVVKVVHEMITNKDGQIVTDDQGNPRWRAVIAWVGEDRGPKPMEATKLSSFRDTMRARLQQLAENSNGSAPPLGKTGTGDDDLRF